MKRLVIVSYGNFPNGEASSIRNYCLAQLFKNIGFDVYMITMSKIKPYEWNEYNGIHYISVRSENRNVINRTVNYFGYKERIKRILKEIGKIDYLMPLSLPLNALMYCEKYAKRNRIQLISDRTEWYSTSEFKLGCLSPQFLQNHITNSLIIDKSWKVISISHYLEQYYKNKSINTVRIPAIMDVKNITMSKRNVNSPKIVVYAGSPAKKDSLSMIVQAFCELDSRGNKDILLKVFGVSKEQFIRLTKFEGCISSNVFFEGRVERKVVLENLMQADFSTIMRDPTQRFTKAGFPSKVAESLAVGIPVIANYTSDLNEVLFHNQNAIIVPQYSMESYYQMLEFASKCSDELIVNMHRNARRTAECYFAYDCYQKEINVLLEGESKNE